MYDTIEQDTISKFHDKIGHVSSELDHCIKTDSPFLIFRFPKSDIHLASLKIGSSSSFSFTPFSSNKGIRLNNIVSINLDNIHNYHRLAPLQNSKPKYRNELYTTDREAFINNVNLAKTQIRNGYLKKVVLSKAKKVDKSIDPIKTFFCLEEKYQSALVYCFYHPSCGLWIGATPEKLIEKDETEQFHIHSLAGTKNVDENWTDKEISEQQIVTEYITEKLIKNGIKDISVDGPLDYKYGSIKHLKSSIYFKSEKELSDLVNIIHPTPAICGMPLEESKKFILDHEGYDRSYYTGHLGFSKFAKHNDTFFVNLRCMQIKNEDNAYIYTGAGIVADSDPSDEWEEVEAKAQTLLDCIISNE